MAGKRVSGKRGAGKRGAGKRGQNEGVGGVRFEEGERAGGVDR